MADTLTTVFTCTGTIFEGANGKKYVVTRAQDKHGDLFFGVGEISLVEDFEPIETWAQAYRIAKRMAEGK